MGLRSGFLILIFSSVGLANTRDVDTFKATYPSSQTYQRFACNVCHSNIAIDTTLGRFGMDYRSGGRGQMSALRRIEATDSDGDGLTNKEEIDGNSNPGDAQSIPIPDNQDPNNPDGGSEGGFGNGSGSESGLEEDVSGKENLLATTSCGSTSGGNHGGGSTPVEILIWFLVLLGPMFVYGFLKSENNYLLKKI